MTTRTSICRMDANWKRTPEGFIDAKVYPTRTGVFPYWDNRQRKVVYELRHPFEVFNPDSLPTLVGKDLSNDHPNEMVKAENYKKYSVGDVYGEHKRAEDGIHTESRVMVKAPDGISAVESGKVNVSCGYTCNLENTPGIYEGVPYDRIQRNIVYNHLALVDRGRMGAGARLTGDSLETSSTERYDAYELEPGEVETEVAGKKDSQPTDEDTSSKDDMGIKVEVCIKCGESNEQEHETESEGASGSEGEAYGELLGDVKATSKNTSQCDLNKTTNIPKGKKRMDHTIKIDKHDVPSTEAGVIILATKIDSLEAAVGTEKSRADAAEASLAELQAKFDIQSKELEAAKKIDVQTLVRDRSALITQANSIAPNDKYDTMTDREIKEFAAKKVFDWAEFTGDNDNDTYVSALYAGAVKEKAKTAGGRNDSDVTKAYEGAVPAPPAGTVNVRDAINWDADPFQEDK